MPAVWPALVEPDLFAEVHQLMATNGRAKALRHTYVLNSGLLWCGACGSAMEGRSGTGRLGKQYFYYACKNKACKLRVVASEIEGAWTQNKLLVHQTLIWVKPHGVLTRSHYLWSHEPCFYGWVEGQVPKLKPPPNQRTVWEADQRGEQMGIHPTQKPVELFTRPIEYHTRPGDVVYEPFSGSGTQLIAAERTGRICYALDKEPTYIDVALKRWEAFSGQTARKQERVG